MKLILIAVLIGNLKVTSYRPIPAQTDSTPFRTSTDEKVRAGGVAVSRDLLCGGCRKLHHRCKHTEYSKKLHYGDWLYIDGFGYRQINDVMGAYSTQRVKGKKVRIPIVSQIDIFVERWSEEHSVGVRHLDVFKVKGERHVR